MLQKIIKGIKKFPKLVLTKGDTLLFDIIIKNNRAYFYIKGD